MAGSVVTVSPRESLDRVEQLARARVARDGIAVLAASSGDGRQVRQLRRLSYRLADDDTLDCYLGDLLGDGATYLTVRPRADRGERGARGWWGGAATS